MMSIQHELGGDSSSTGTDVAKEHFAILVIGKTGNGKSSLCNTIFGEMIFQTGRSMSSTTTEAQDESTERDGYRLLVVDTPDVSNLDLDERQMQQETDKWKNKIRGFSSTALFVVLLAVRCDVRYTAEEYATYRDFLRLWGDNSVKNRLVVAFTFGDRQNGDIGDELKRVCPELKNVLRDARGRYVVFNNEENAGRKARMVGELFTKVKNIRDEETQGPVWSWKESIVLILLIVTGVLFACGVTKRIPALAAVFGLAYFVILAVNIWQKLQLTSFLVRLRLFAC